MVKLTIDQLMADLLATFPGIHARPAAEYGASADLRPYQHGLWVSGEAEIGDMPMFSTLECADPDEYNGRVLHAFEQWLADRGYELVEYDLLVYFAVPAEPEGER
jgi:hypothetical protein